MAILLLVLGRGEICMICVRRAFTGLAWQVNGKENAVLIADR